jgi:hypothetical protein
MALILQLAMNLCDLSCAVFCVLVCGSAFGSYRSLQKLYGQVNASLQ